jgi:hypothetical protein
MPSAKNKIKDNIKNIANAQRLQEAQVKAQEAKMERVVVANRDKIVPVIKKYNLEILETKQMIEMITMAINQSVYSLMQRLKVKDLELVKQISKEFPNHQMAKDILNAIKDEDISFGVESTQWLAQKIDAILKEENKGRKLDQINLDF